MAEAKKESSFHWSRKRVNENLGLILTAIAAIATALAWNEARLTRKAAHDDAEKSLIVQQQSVEKQRDSVEAQIKQGEESIHLQRDALQAQIDALHLDDRPFVTASVKSIGIYQLEDRIGFSYDVILNHIGKTAAFKIEVKSDCSFTGGGAFEKSKINDVEKHGVVFIADDLGLNQSRPVGIICYVPAKTRESSGQRLVTFRGVVAYMDIFQQNHVTTFCYTSPVRQDLVLSLKHEPLRVEDCSSRPILT
jgi:hypothetical protein